MMKRFLASVSLVVLFTLTCGARQDTPPMTPEQSAALTSALRLMTASVGLQREGKLDEAIALREQAQPILDKAFGGEDLVSALNLSLVAFLHEQKGDHRKAEAAYLRALAVREKLHGPNHEEVAGVLTGLGAVYLHKEDFAKAEQVYSRALSIQEKALGADDPQISLTLFALAASYSRRGAYARAEPLLRRALSMQEKAFGPEHAIVAGTVNNLAYLLSEKGDYGQAETLFQRSIAIYEKTLGPDSSQVATPLNSLASLYRQQGDYVRAEPLFKRALGIAEKTTGPESEDYAIALNSLAILYSEKGDEERALELFQRALAVREKVLGPENSSVAANLISIAQVRVSRGEHDKAIELYKRALGMVEKTVGAETSLYATMLNNLAIAYIEQGDAARAEPLARRSLAIKERALGPDHPDVAIALNTLAHLSFMRGKFDDEEPLYRRALQIAEKSLGPYHPAVGSYLANLSTIYWARGDTRQALAALLRASELRERNLAIVLTTGSEEQKQRYMATLANETDANVSFHLRAAPDDAGAANLALTTILRRKGRVLDAMADQIGALRRRLNPQDRALLEQLSATRSALARLTLGEGAATQDEEKTRLQAEARRLEEEVSARSGPELRAELQPVTLDGVRRMIPAGAALVEFALYRPYDPKGADKKRFGAARYAAYVMRGGGELRWIDLGEAATVDKELTAWRVALISPASADARPRGRAVEELLMRPVRRLLGETRQVFLSPDGALNLIPFGALVDEQGRYLVENYTITYLTSGRDLLRLQLNAASREPPLVIANPAFDGGAAAAASEQGARPAESSQARRSGSLADTAFMPLPGTKGEASALGTIMAGARVFTEMSASEAMLKRASAPSVLHVATHGFFLPDQVKSDAADDTGLEVRGVGLTRQKAEGENPLLRSGIALAGANRRQGGAGEDGVLTALEAAGLDLWGTKLVVLSACETGVGEVKNGEGVYGLRRALVLAGSESQVMSLWQVSDEATRDLMVGYYQRLQAGEGRTEALRNVQLAMIKSGAAEGASGPTRGMQSAGALKATDRSHPFYWAAFIQSGDWRSMNGKAGGMK